MGEMGRNEQKQLENFRNESRDFFLLVSWLLLAVTFFLIFLSLGERKSRGQVRWSRDQVYLEWWPRVLLGVQGGDGGGTMFLNMDQLEKQLDKEEFQEIGSMAAFKVDTSKALDTSLVDTKSSGTESKEQDTISRSRNDAHADDADIRPIYDEEPMAEVQLIADHNVFATGQQHTEQPEFNNE
ncbi:hypothetical protein Tco_1274006 [Tanacetum coccineum]